MILLCRRTLKTNKTKMNEPCIMQVAKWWCSCDQKPDHIINIIYIWKYPLSKMPENESNLQNKLKLIKALQCNDIFTSNKIGVKKHSFWQGHVHLDSGTVPALYLLFLVSMFILLLTPVGINSISPFPPPPFFSFFVCVCCCCSLKVKPLCNACILCFI